MAVSSRSSSPNPSPPKGKKGKANATGFVQKLCEMVNGAPDDVVSWIPSGEAFRISDLARLESETLPQYFRHNRFQSLVRQLNFYNFRKINRERTFWIYYHPMFHRDRPEDHHKLKRRTCPGYDGRKNRSDRAATPPPAAPPAGITWSSEDEVQEKRTGGGTAGMISPAGVKVSRSPSPSYAPMEHPPAGKGSVQLRPVVSEEGSFVSSFHRTVSNDARMNEYDTEPSSEEYVADQLRAHTKKSRKARQAYWTDDDDDDSRYSYSGNRKKYSKEELEERQEHRLTVLEVSRDLDGICADYASSVATGKSRSRRGANGDAAFRSATASPVFGLDKPHNHYYGAGKCDLFTYDCEDGFEIDVSNEKATVVTPSKDLEPKPTEEKVAVVPPPPSQCTRVITSVAQACMDGKIGDTASVLERTLASAILTFCMSNHPKDPDLASKIHAHIAKGPVLAKEFRLYYQAMAPSQYSAHGMGSSEDLKRKWRLFSSTVMGRVKLARNHEVLTGDENEAIERCVASWSQEV